MPPQPFLSHNFLFSPIIFFLFYSRRHTRTYTHTFPFISPPGPFPPHVSTSKTTPKLQNLTHSLSKITACIQFFYAHHSYPLLPFHSLKGDLCRDGADGEYFVFFFYLDRHPETYKHVFVFIDVIACVLNP